MINSVIGALFILFPPVVIPQPDFAKEVRMSESWADPNFVLCEGVGIHGSGRVAVTTVGVTNGDVTELSFFNVSVTNAQTNFRVSGRIHWKDPNGREQSSNLMEPWYKSVSRLGSKTLVLPRVVTSDRGSGPWEARKITVGSDRQVRIEIYTTFSQAGGICSSSFSETWTLPVD